MLLQIKQGKKIIINAFLYDNFPSEEAASGHLHPEAGTLFAWELWPNKSLYKKC